MVSTRLLLENTQTSPPIYLDNCPQVEEQSITTTYQISDVRDPEYSEVSKTVTFKIPETKEVRLFFENVANVNVALSTFNPNLKIRAYYYIDEILAFDGYLQILDIEVDEVNKYKVYNCNILGEVGNLMTRIKDLQLNELDFSAYDHDLTFANIVASWSTTPGTGYVYPLEDNGSNNGNLMHVKPEHFRAALFKREILYKIFQAQGYTWTSSFLDSTEFKKKVQPASDLPVLSSTVTTNNKFLSLSDGTQVFSFVVPQLVGSSFEYTNNTYTTLQFPNETYDAGSLFDDVTTFMFTPAVSNKYNISVYQALNFVLKDNTNADVSADIFASVGSTIQVSIINNTTSAVIGTNSIGFTDNMNFSPGNANAINVILTNIDLVAGEDYVVKIKFVKVALALTPFANTPFTLYTTNVTGSNFSAEFATNNFYEGANIECNSLLPTNYKQSDFVSDLRKEYHLQFLADKENPNNIIIEPWVGFHTGDSYDWTHKHDTGNVKVIPMGELNFNQINISHSEDGDYFNKKHQDEYKYAYGTYIKQIDNDFWKSKKEIKTLISPTPYALNEATGLVVPTRYKAENNVITPIKTNVRSWHWSGLINLPVGVSWTFVYNNGANSVTYNTMPHAGHTDNPYNPTIDMSFDEPNRLYFNIPNQQWTTANLYNRFYDRYFNEITDKNSKLIQARFYLTPYDIHTFDFRKYVFCIIDGEQGYYVVNRIEEYNPLKNEPTLVELLKVVGALDFVEETIPYEGGTANDPKDAFNNNSYNPQNNIIGGSGNTIAPGAENVTLIGCENVTVDASVSNFIGAGLSNMNINSTYSNSNLNGNEITVPVTTDLSIDRSYHGKTLLLDATGSDITITYDIYNMNDVRVELIRKDNSANDIFIDSTTTIGTENFIGNSFPYNLSLTQYEAIPTKTISDTIYISR